jgi:protocatechuate 3,4-dioxygenase beta subunit
MDRNEFLTRGFGSLLGLTAVGPIVAACSKDTTVTPTTATGSTDTGSTNGSSAGDCAVSPSETAGPFPTKSPASFVRKDITNGRPGVPLAMTISVKSGKNGCAPLAGIVVDVWHCDAAGNYSEYGGTGMQAINYATVDFLRGRQTTDAGGVAAFTTIFPGWYGGRAPHIHVQVFTASGTSLLVTQIAFPYAVSNGVYTTAQAYGYSKGVQDTTNERDNVFSDSIATELATMSGSNSAGYVLAFNVVVNA